MNSSIKVLVTDDHQLFATGLGELVSGFERVSNVKAFFSAAELILSIKNNVPDVLLLDIEMPGMDGIECMTYLKRRYAAMKVIIITMHDGAHTVMDALDRGADVVLPKDASPCELRKAVYDMVDYSVFESTLMIRARDNYKIAKFSVPASREKSLMLTDRELQIIRLICREMTSKQIAYDLRLSEKTVHNHRTKIIKKLEVESVVGLVKFAFQNNLLASEVNG